MGLPPAWRLTRKLVKVYLRKQRPHYYQKQIKEEQAKLSQLVEQEYLRDRAQISYEKLVGLYKEEQEFEKQLKKLELKKQILGQLNMPPYKHHVKGKCRDVYTGYRPVKRCFKLKNLPQIMDNCIVTNFEESDSKKSQQEFSLDHKINFEDSKTQITLNATENQNDEDMIATTDTEVQKQLVKIESKGEQIFSYQPQLLSYLQNQFDRVFIRVKCSHNLVSKNNQENINIIYTKSKQLKLKFDTFFLTVYLTQYYMSLCKKKNKEFFQRNIIKKKKSQMSLYKAYSRKQIDFQILSQTCMFLASKYNETEFPDINQYFYPFDINNKKFVEYEKKILVALNFNIFLPPIETYVYIIENELFGGFRLKGLFYKCILQILGKSFCFKVSLKKLILATYLNLIQNIWPKKICDFKKLLETFDEDFRSIKKVMTYFLNTKQEDQLTLFFITANFVYFQKSQFYEFFYYPASHIKSYYCN